MLGADWQQDGTATWQPGNTIQVVHLSSGWAARLRGRNGKHADAFPYDSKAEAQYAAEALAKEAWGSPDR